MRAFLGAKSLQSCLALCNPMDYNLSGFSIHGILQARILEWVAMPFRESIPRQVDKKSGVPREEKGVWGSRNGDRGLEFSRKRKGQTSFFLHIP